MLVPEAAHAVDAGPIPAMPADSPLGPARPVQRNVSVHDRDAGRVLDHGREARQRAAAAVVLAARIEAGSRRGR